MLGGVCWRHFWGTCAHAKLRDALVELVEVDGEGDQHDSPLGPGAVGKERRRCINMPASWSVCSVDLMSNTCAAGPVD